MQKAQSRVHVYPALQVSPAAVELYNSILATQGMIDHSNCTLMVDLE
jgi:hypothetical protein